MDNISTDNYKKHTTKSSLQRLLMNRFFDEIIQIIKPLKIQNILDVGCGEGFTLKRIYDSGIKSKAEGIEYLDSAIKIGKKENPSIKIKKGTIYKLPYPDNKFDLVICTEVLEHLENPELALMELKRVSNKYVLISVPNEPFFMLANLLRGKNISRWGNDIEHINHWSFWSFQSFIKSKGVNIAKKFFPFPWTIVLVLK